MRDARNEIGPQPVESRQSFSLAEDRLARGLLGWLVPNAVFLVMIRGLGKIHSIPHLLVYPVLVVMLTRRMFAEDATDRERRFAFLVVVTNAISIAFDIMDAAAWVGGDRSTAGLEAA